MRRFHRTSVATYKTHQCQNCGEVIEIGEEYFQVFVTGENKQYKYHTKDCSTKQGRSRRPTLPKRGWKSG